ncbi:hypothetical protein MC885_010811 [Smutsia gigantea]|nr:hypothetical protein MC885_010811 [Smutsia gigantea]
MAQNQDALFCRCPQLNNSDSGLFTVFTGVKDLSKIHLVDRWNGLSKVSFWHSDQCNMINGTSGQMWAPFMTPESYLEFYSPEACRSMRLTFKESGIFEGIPTYRFVAPDTLFANGSVYPPNEGFCPCLESGIQNVSTCRFSAPLFLSHPHFYNADPVLAQAVLGLHPDPEEHSLFLDIHPVTGIPMNCSVKLQLSLYIKAIKGIGQTGRIQPVVLPLLWFSESGTMEGETLQTFYSQLVLMPSALQYTQYFLLALGCILLLIPIVYQILKQVGSGRGVVWPRGIVLAYWGKARLGSRLLAFPSLPGAQFGQRISAWCRGSVAEKCYLFWSSSKKGPKDKEAIQAYSESLMTSAPRGTVLQEARL